MEWESPDPCATPKNPQSPHRRDRSRAGETAAEEHGAGWLEAAAGGSRKRGRCGGSSISSPTCGARVEQAGHPLSSSSSPLRVAEPRGSMADRKRKRAVGLASPGRGRCWLLDMLRRVRPRRAYRAPPLPPPSPSDSTSSTDLEADGTRPSYPRPLLRGTRSIRQPKPWTCGACGFKNELIHHLLFDLPPFKCKSCNADPPEGSIDFGFCYGDLALNGFCPIGNVKDQTGPTCIASSLSSLVEITHRVMKIILEEPLSEGPIVDVDDLLKKYKKFCGAGRETFDVNALKTMIHVLEVVGVKDKESNELYKICDWDHIDEHDFAALCSALADGYPLLTGFQTGKRIFDLQPGEVYVPPKQGSIGKDGKSKPEGHMVVLVGAQQERRDKLFYFLSSWSEEFCQRMFEGEGILGGIAAIRADGIDFSPIQILRFGERSEQEVHHPEYPSL